MSDADRSQGAESKYPWMERTIQEFHARQGLGIQPWGDHLLLMTARGARSGDSRTYPLVYRRDGDNLVVVASKGGRPGHPDWYRNVQVNRDVEVQVAAEGGIVRERRRARALASGPERDRLYAYMTEVWPAFAEYQQRADRVIPVVVLEPAG